MFSLLVPFRCWKIIQSATVFPWFSYRFITQQVNWIFCWRTKCGRFYRSTPCSPELMAAASLFINKCLLSSKDCSTLMNPLRAELCGGNKGYVCFCITHRHWDGTGTLNPSLLRTLSISCLLMAWRRKESIHQKPCYLLGGRLNIKMSSYQYRHPHVKDESVSRPSYL